MEDGTPKRINYQPWFNVGPETSASDSNFLYIYHLFFLPQSSFKSWCVLTFHDKKYLYVHQWILLFIFKSINFHDNIYKIIPTYLRGISPCTSFKTIPNFYNSQETNIHFICRIQFCLIPLKLITKTLSIFSLLDKIRRRKNCLSSPKLTQRDCMQTFLPLQNFRTWCSLQSSKSVQIPAGGPCVNTT